MSMFQYDGPQVQRARNSGRPQRHGAQRVTFDTPERECAHADKGCCPKCLDPMKVRVLKGFTLETVAHSAN